MGWHATRHWSFPLVAPSSSLLDDESVPGTPETTQQAELPSLSPELELAETSLALRNRDRRKDACWPEWDRVLLFSVSRVPDIGIRSFCLEG
jgi:hypothetical protein